MEIKPITKGILMLTTGCNLACEYCFENHAHPRHMTFETAKRALDYMQSNCKDGQKVRLTFFGGEPLLMFDSIIVPLVEYGKTLEHPINFSMTTNGTLLTEDKLKFIKENDIKFMLSFDGLREIQEQARPMRDGESSYDKIVDIWDRIMRSKKCISVRGTPTKEWLDRLFDEIMFMESKHVTNLHLVPNYWETWDEKDQDKLLYQLSKYEEYIIERFRDGKMPLLFTDYSAGFWRISSALKQQNRREILACQPKARCGMGVRGSCSITPEGDMFGCHHISPLNRDSEWYIGNVYDGLDEARVQHLISKYDKDIIGNEHCKSCPLDKTCDGGCTPTNVMVTGDVNIVPETFCIWKRAITDSANRVLQTLGNEENELFKEVFMRWCWNG